ncbi:uncharacterized protein LOC117315634 isoform X2 [Pecten maximus]|uniref:uncharacterized protein LOC117315634 isoform X2 n=1 Tax=Pecten maximus TaxID=6579 RepID=UPI001458056B|nr:uncharacterized protein LOC117315634 isoform X2 [Pecten maximus]
MITRVSTTLLRPSAVRSSVVRNFGGESAYEKVFSRKSVIHPLNAIKEKELSVVTGITGIAVSAAIAYPLYYLFTNIDISLNKARPYTWHDARPGHRDVLFTRRKYGDLHKDIKNMTSLLDNPNDEKMLGLEEKIAKIKELRKSKE